MQLALDVYGGPGRAALVQAATTNGADWTQAHQLGRYRTPWTWATGPTPDAPVPQAGDLMPAWVCCHCGAVEMTRHSLLSDHGCRPDDDGRCGTWCHRHTRPPAERTHPYRMDAHWIPPVRV